MASEQKSKLGRFWLQTCVTHTYLVVDTQSPYGYALLQCSDKVHSRTSTPCSPGSLPVPCYAIGGVTVRVFFTCMHTCTVRPPFSSDPIDNETLAFTVLSF